MRERESGDREEDGELYGKGPICKEMHGCALPPCSWEKNKPPNFFELGYNYVHVG